MKINTSSSFLLLAINHYCLSISTDSFTPLQYDVLVTVNQDCLWYNTSVMPTAGFEPAFQV